MTQNFCTGPRSDREFSHLSTVEGWHGLFGHLNVVKPDHKTSVTNFGKHDRVVAFYPEGNTAYCRIDHVWGLGSPNDAEIIKEFKNRNNLRGRWKVVSRELYDDEKSTDVTLERA